MARIFIRPRWILKYPHGVGYGVMRSVYLAFSEWNEALYPQILSRTPVSRDSPHPGLIKRHLKLMWTTGARGIKYKAIGVPGCNLKGSPAYEAYMAIKTLHEGRRAVLITGKKMTFPVGRVRIRNPKVARQGPGRGRGPKNWVFTQRVSQKARGPKNQWITDTYTRNQRLLLTKLRESVLAQRTKTGEGKEKRIEIS